MEFFPGAKDVFVSFDLLVVRRRIGYTFYQEFFPFFLGVDLMASLSVGRFIGVQALAMSDEVFP